MKTYTHGFLIASLSSLLLACAQTPTAEEQVVEESATNPVVRQRAVDESKSEVKPDDPRYRPIRVDSVDSVQVPTGSLFSQQTAVSLYELNRNFSVGDMILIRLEENTSSSKSLDYSTEKSTSLTINPTTVTAGSVQIDETDFNVEYGQDGDFESAAETSQSNTLDGDITVFVKEVLPNDNLVIAGEKWIKLNKGQEYVRFSGEVRAKDIDIDNSVSSSKIGNARIEYSGKGPLKDNQDNTVLGKLLSAFD